MGKMTYALLTVLLIEMALYFFGGTSYTHSNLFMLISNISGIESNQMWIAIMAALALGTAGIVASAFFQLNTYAIYAGIGVFVITFGLSIAHLGAFLYGQLNSIAPQVAQIITMLIIAPFLISYIIAVMDWVRNNT